jgi:hypothetical protein
VFEQRVKRGLRQLAKFHFIDHGPSVASLAPGGFDGTNRIF